MGRTENKERVETYAPLQRFEDISVVEIVITWKLERITTGISSSICLNKLYLSIFYVVYTINSDSFSSARTLITPREMLA